MRNPERFATFVLGTFVFVYYIAFGIKTIRVWLRVGHCPIAAFSEGGLGNVLHAAGGLLGPVPVLAWAWRPSWFAAWEIPSLENWPVRLLGLLGLCAGLSVGSLSLAELGDHWRVGVEASSSPRLVDSGIYGSIRHPIYCALLLAFSGVFLMAPNFLFAALLGLAGVGVSTLAAREENFLEARLGLAYREYRERTGRFFP